MSLLFAKFVVYLIVALRVITLGIIALDRPRFLRIRRMFIVHRWLLGIEARYRGWRDGRLGIPRADETEAPPEVWKLKRQGDGVGRRIGAKWVAYDLRLKGETQGHEVERRKYARKQQALEAELSEEDKRYRERRQELDRKVRDDELRHADDRWRISTPVYVGALLLIFIGEFPLNAVAFNLFGEERVLTWVMTTALAAITDRVRSCARCPLAQAAPDPPRRADCQGAPRDPVPRHPRDRPCPPGVRDGAGQSDCRGARFHRRASRLRGHERVDLRGGVRDLIPPSRPGDPRRGPRGKGRSTCRTTQEACTALGRSCRLAHRALRQPQAAVGSGKRRIVGRSEVRGIPAQGHLRGTHPRVLVGEPHGRRAQGTEATLELGSPAKAARRRCSRARAAGAGAVRVDPCGRADPRRVEHGARPRERRAKRVAPATALSKTSSRSASPRESRSALRGAP